MRTDKIYRFIILICGFFLTVSLSGCAGNLFTAKEKIETENVMVKGDRIVATFNDFGTLTITAGKDNIRYLTLSGTGRNITWLGDTARVKLKEEGKRYRGLYCNTNTKDFRCKDCYRYSSRVEMVEAQLHLDTLEAAKEWSRMAKKRFDEGFNPHAWSSDGMYVQWGMVCPEYLFFPPPCYLYVEVYQLYVDGNEPASQQSEGNARFGYENNGHLILLRKPEKGPVKIGGLKPSDLPYARNDKIRVEHLTDEQLKEFEKSVKGWLW